MPNVYAKKFKRWRFRTYFEGHQNDSIDKNHKKSGLINFAV